MELETNLKNVNCLLNKLEGSMKNVEETISEKETILSNHIDYMKQEIEIRIESLVQELDNIKIKMFKKLDSLHQTTDNYLTRLITKYEKESKKYKESTQNIKKFIAAKSDNFEFVENENTLNFYLDKLKQYECEFNNLFSKVSFEPSNSSFSDDIVGIIESDLIIGDMIKARTYQIKELTEAKLASSICSIDDKYLLVIDKKSNKIIRFNSDLKVCEQISTIDRLKLSKPSLICTDEIDNVYICYSNSTKIIITDLYMKQIKTVLGTNANDFSFIKDIKFSDGNLYVLDATATAIQIYKFDGEFIRKFHLYKSKSRIESMNNPLGIAVYEDMVAILDDSRKIYIYSSLGNYINNLVFDNIGFIKSICFANNYLFIHAGDGAFVCYKTNFKSENHKDMFELCFEREINVLRESSEGMVYFNKQILILLPYDKVIVSF